MTNIITLSLYIISAAGFIVQMYYVINGLMAPSFSITEVKHEKLGLLKPNSTRLLKHDI